MNSLRQFLLGSLSNEHRTYQVQFRDTEEAETRFLIASAIFLCKHVWALFCYPHLYQPTMLSHISDDTLQNTQDTAKPILHDQARVIN